jgi:hypothetical protein
MNKVNPSHYRHEKGYGERRYSSYSFLASALDGGDWSRQFPATLYLWGKDPVVY